MSCRCCWFTLKQHSARLRNEEGEFVYRYLSVFILIKSFSKALPRNGQLQPDYDAFQFLFGNQTWPVRINFAEDLHQFVLGYLAVFFLKTAQEGLVVKFLLAHSKLWIHLFLQKFGQLRVCLCVLNEFVELFFAYKAIFAGVDFFKHFLHSLSFFLFEGLEYHEELDWVT